MTSTLVPTTADPTTDALTPADRAVLARALDVLRAARLAAANPDPATASKGRQQLATVVGYVTGYMDARGLGAGSAPGLGALFPPDTAPSLDAALDHLESLLESATRTGVRFDLGVGDVVVAIGEALVAVGHALQAAGI